MPTRNPAANAPATRDPRLIDEFVPQSLRDLQDPQRDLPRIAKDRALTAEIEAAIQEIPTRHDLYHADAREVDFLADGSVQLVVTSPPYWTLKEYNPSDGQLGWVADYEEFLSELDKVCDIVIGPWCRAGV
jgi:hypothetical protein